MNDGDIKIVMNVYYNPVDGLRKLIEGSNGLYVPVIGGADGNGYCTDDWCKSHLLRDDVGENISSRNGRLNELTSIYWYWKNRMISDKPKYVGYNHYRRFFPLEQLSDVEKYDIIAAKPFPMVFRNAGDNRTINCDIEFGYKICHVYTDWLEMELELAKLGYDTCIWKRLPYLPYSCNMFVMKTELFDEYCNFAFPILDRLDGRINTDGRDNYQKRAMAFLSERLFSFWVFHKRVDCGCSVKEVDTVFKPEWKDNFLNERGTY